MFSTRAVQLAFAASCLTTAAAAQDLTILDSTAVVGYMMNPCTTQVTERMGAVRKPYSISGDSAIFIVRPNGDVLRRPTTSIDEDDYISVTVIADQRLLSSLQVTRTSRFGMPDSLTIAGAGTRVDMPLRVLARPESAVPHPCGAVTTRLYDFAPGEGQVGILATTTHGPKTVGAFDFGVRRTYTGALSFAFVHSEVRDPSYGLTASPASTDSVITIKSGNRPTNLFAVFYTPFLLGRRDLQKYAGSPLHYINPTFGLSINDFGKNAMAGLSLEIPTAGVSLLAGAHAGRVNRLDPNSGYHPGSTFSGPSSRIPVQEFWSIRRFVAVGLDLRAAAQFVAAAAGSGKAKQ